MRKIKDNFKDIFNEMKTVGVKRYKNHQILIAKEVKAYLIQAKIDAGNASSDDEISDSDSVSNANSLNSDRIEKDFVRAMETLNTGTTIPGMPSDDQGIIHDASLPISLAQKKYIDRKKKFDHDFEKTLKNFSINMDFLTQQREKVRSSVNHMQGKSNEAIHIMNKMNIHMSGIVQDLNEIDGLVEFIQNKQKQ